MEIRAREQWRVERLEKVVMIASEMLGMDEAQLRHLINHIDDHQGHLAVFWHHPMTDVQARAFSIAWKLCGEDPDNTSHRVFW